MRVLDHVFARKSRRDDRALGPSNATLILDARPLGTESSRLKTPHRSRSKLGQEVSQPLASQSRGKMGKLEGNGQRQRESRNDSELKDVESEDMDDDAQDDVLDREVSFHFADLSKRFKKTFP